MYSWLDDLLLLAFGIILIVLVILASGCTAQTREQQAAAAAAVEGHYVDGIGCTRIRTATGRAAVKAAASNAERQIEVKR